MPFQLKDLHRCQLPPGIEQAPIHMEVYDRRALLEAVPEEDREAYEAEADRWVEEHGGYRFGPEFNLYIIPAGTRLGEAVAEMPFRLRSDRP